VVKVRETGDFTIMNRSACCWRPAAVVALEPCQLLVVALTPRVVALRRPAELQRCSDRSVSVFVNFYNLPSIPLPPHDCLLSQHFSIPTTRYPPCSPIQETARHTPLIPSP
jgi:hypothetical protein